MGDPVNGSRLAQNVSATGCCSPSDRPLVETQLPIADLPASHITARLSPNLNKPIRRTTTSRSHLRRLNHNGFAGTSAQIWIIIYQNTQIQRSLRV
ncbi:unnamed protein product [Protopolystoma xenopodis]|uniref:Uncharacterized protein n=1 Tax=Protopolystoma xenopodis TaxID=117903 RepID=A0A448X341_9PLAT|nr:unnamed protein product [Protopolystoma xenopodis]